MAVRDATSRRVLCPWARRGRGAGSGRPRAGGTSAGHDDRTRHDASRRRAEPPPPLPPLLIPDGVTIGSSSVGGFSVDQARLVVETAFAQPLEIVHKRLRWLVAPTRLGAKPRVEAALAQALVAPPGSQVPLVVTVQGQAVHEYVSKLGQRVNRQPKDSRLRLVKLRPRISEARPGLRVDRYPTVAAIVQALKAKRTRPGGDRDRPDQAGGHAGELRARGRHPAGVETALPLPRREALADVRGRHRAGRLPDADRPLLDRHDAAEPVVVSTTNL